MSGNEEREEVGCNIHGYVEVNIWYDNPGMGRIDWQGLLREPPLDRDYRVFAMLANVRRYDMTLPIIAEPKGFPQNISEEMTKLSENYGVDGHSHSWLSAGEMLANPWTLYDISQRWELWLSIFFKIVRVYGENNVRFVFFFDC